MTTELDQADGMDWAPRRTFIGAIVLSPILWGLVATFGFYAALPHFPFQTAFLTRYFCSHPLAYITTAMFLVGASVLIGKAFRLRVEQSAYRSPLAMTAGLQSGDGIVAVAEQIRDMVTKQPRSLQQTQLGRRQRDFAEYLLGRRSSSGVQEHLKYLAELEAENLHDSYALVRTITWAVPILGFLGTVIGITLAIANVTPEQLDTSLTDVTSGLAVAFDTTALALGLSIVMVFGTFSIERAEQRLLARTERFGIEHLLHQLPGETSPGDGLIAAEAEAAQKLLRQTESLIEQHTHLWQQSLEGLRARWSDTLADQQQELQSALSTSIRATTSDHADQLDAVRRSFLQAFQAASGTLEKAIGTWESQQMQLSKRIDERIETILSSVHGELSSLHVEQRQQLEMLVTSLRAESTAWRTELQQMGGQLSEQSQQMQQSAAGIAEIVQQTDALERLQQQLSNNLETVRVAETFDQTMHSLSAAVHLLTARTGNQKAA